MSTTSSASRSSTTSPVAVEDAAAYQPSPSPSAAAATVSTPASDVVVSLQQVSVRYRMANERINTLKEQVVRRLSGRRVEYNEFWALRDVSLDVRQGEAVGLVGRNGAGKSTLLKVIARVQKPSGGRVIVRGHLSPMIELGAGFHHELTGRENVYINGAMLGFSRGQMQKKFDSIVDFSGLAEFIDSPLRTYSSGMTARLGFAIAAEVDPDILIIDEALSVGDEAFQKKCVARMTAFRQSGVTIFFVTHAMDAIASLCPRSIWLDGGCLRAIGPTERVVAAYRDSLENGFNLADSQKLQIVRAP